ncbi:MAG: amidohydrolase family protein, partial [Bacteroidota bacterium]
MFQRGTLLLAFFLLLSVKAFGQIAPVTGLRDNTPTVHAFTNARIVVAPGKVIAKGTLVIRDGTIESVGENVTPPADARVWNMEGRTLYAGLIDLSSDYGFPKPVESQPVATRGQAPPPPEKPKGAAHWNTRMMADFDASAEFQPDSKSAEKLRSQGFTLVLATPQRGIFRGSSALVNLGDGPVTDLVVKRKAAQAVTFEQSQGFGGGYPGSLMGMIAFIRQSWIDADWYRNAWESYNTNPDQRRPETNTALAALADAVQGRQPVIMEASSDLNFFRETKIGKEFSLNLLVRGSGDEYRRIDAVKSSKVPVIVTLNFPEAPNVATPEDALNVSLDELRDWDAAPENAGRLEKAGVLIALSAAELKDAGTFLAQARKAIERGLSSDGALAALTTNPARWIGVDNQYGTLDKGKTANIVITDGDLLAEKTKIQEVWIDGKRYEVKANPVADARGTWSVELSILPGTPETLTLKGENDKPTGSIKFMTQDVRLATVTLSAERIAVTFSGDSIGHKGTVRMSGTVGEKDMYGVGEFPEGVPFTWSATRTEPPKPEPDTTK